MGGDIRTLARQGVRDFGLFVINEHARELNSGDQVAHTRSVRVIAETRDARKGRERQLKSGVAFDRRTPWFCI